ncbi:MAG: SPOR domain-containing protein [Pseudomonadota bacterium]
MDSNRNLSSIITRIRDEGPPGAATRKPPQVPEDSYAVPEDPPRAPAFRDELQALSAQLLTLLPRNRAFGLVLPLLLVMGVVYFAGSYTGSSDDAKGSGAGRQPLANLSGKATQADSTGAGVVTAGVPRVVTGEQTVQARLAQLTAEMELLGATVADNRAVTEAMLADLRHEQQAALAALEARLQPQANPNDAQAAVSPAQPATAAAAMPAGAATGADVTTQISAQHVSPVQQAVNGGGQAGEEWVVNVAAFANEQSTAALADRLRNQGISVERQVVKIDGGQIYRLRVPGFASSTDARRYAREIDAQYGLKGAWISRK